MTIRRDFVTIGHMDKNERKPRSVRDDRSFSNGNMGPDDGPQMEGWLIHSAHWWLM